MMKVEEPSCVKRVLHVKNLRKVCSHINYLDGIMFQKFLTIHTYHCIISILRNTANVHSV